VEIYRFNHVTCNVATMLEMFNEDVRTAWVRYIQETCKYP